MSLTAVWPWGGSWSVQSHTTPFFGMQKVAVRVKWEKGNSWKVEGPACSEHCWCWPFDRNGTGKGFEELFLNGDLEKLSGARKRVKRPADQRGVSPYVWSGREAPRALGNWAGWGMLGGGQHSMRQRAQAGRLGGRSWWQGNQCVFRYLPSNSRAGGLEGCRAVGTGSFSTQSVCGNNVWDPTVLRFWFKEERCPHYLQI